MATQSKTTALRNSPDEHTVSTQILGPVLNSEVLTAGGDIILNGTRLRHSVYGSNNRVLLSSVDWDLLDISGISVNNSTSQAILGITDLELRLLLIAIPPEGCVVIPPTYYYESPLCRLLFDNHRPTIEAGYIRLVTEYLDINEYLDRKRERYQKAAHFDHYRDAYYVHNLANLTDYSFQRTSKIQSIGRQTLQSWIKELDDVQSRVQLAPAARTELRKRCFDTEQPSFLWENVSEHLERLGINPLSLGASQLRVLRTRLYLASYSLNGIAIPSGSELVTDILVPGTALPQYDLRAWRAIFEIIGLLDMLRDLPTERLLKLKKREEVAVAIAQIRCLLANGAPSDEILLKLRRRRMLTSFVKAFSAQ